MNNKLEELMAATKINEFLRRRDPVEQKKRKFLWILAIIGGITLVAMIAYAVYRYMNPNYLDDFDDDFDDYEEMFSDDEDTPAIQSDSNDSTDFEEEASDDDYESEE